MKDLYEKPEYTSRHSCRNREKLNGQKAAVNSDLFQPHIHTYIFIFILFIQYISSYNRGDYTAMRKTLDIRWAEKLEPHRDDPDKQWTIFTEVLAKAQEAHIPYKDIGQQCKRRRGPPIDKQTYEAAKKKHRAWQRYMETGSTEKYKEFTRHRNKVRKMTRKLERDLEKSICQDAKSNPKRFWNFIKGKLKTTSGVADLVRGRDEEIESLTKSDKEKTEVLAKFFCSVFTREPDTELPATSNKNFDRALSTITVTTQ